MTHFRFTSLRVACLCMSGLLPHLAQASSPGEQVQCTTQPESQWIGEKRIRQIFGEKDYATISFKISRTHCYEFYAIRKDGDIVEAYYNPATGELMKFNRVAKDGRYSPSAPIGKAPAAAPSGKPTMATSPANPR